MKRRREASRLTDDPIVQPDIAALMKVDASHVSRLESGKRHLINLTGTQLYILLRGYRFTPLEIQGIVTRYKLNTPPELLQDLTASAGMVTVVSEGGITHRSSPVPMTVPEAYLDGHAPGSVT